MLERLKHWLGAGKSAERSIYYHEDGYCQTELLPASAWGHCASQMDIIDEFAVKNSAGDTGFADIYVRPEALPSFAELRIPVSAVSAAVQPHFPAYDSVFTGYSSYRERCESTLAWGEGSFVILADHQDGIVQHIWLIFGARESFDAERVGATLRALPESNRILIADWSWSTIVDLSDTAALDNYLGRRTGST